MKYISSIVDQKNLDAHLNQLADHGWRLNSIVPLAEDKFLVVMDTSGFLQGQGMYAAVFGGAR